MSTGLQEKVKHFYPRKNFEILKKISLGLKLSKK